MQLSLCWQFCSGIIEEKVVQSGEGCGVRVKQDQLVSLYLSSISNADHLRGAPV
jgi:hypothetical protein